MKIPLFIIILAISFFSGCKLFYPPISFYPDCFDGKYTGVDTLIHTQGYYALMDTTETGEALPLHYPFKIGFILFPDGTFVNDFSATLFMTTKEKSFYKGGGDWGLYRIFGDTIKATFVNPSGGMSRSRRELWLRIIDDHTIEWLFFKYRGAITEEDVRNRFKTEGYKTYYSSFFPLDKIPDPDRAFVKRDRIFWCKEQDFLRYQKEKEAKGN